MSWLEKLCRLVLGRPFLTAVLLLGSALRLIGINNVSPPGLAHDEVANWLIDRSILAGNHAIYFTRAYGHEAGFHYLQAGSIALFGDNAFALRLPAAFAGILGIAVTFALVRKLFGRETAVYATLITALLFWPIFYSRLALRAILLPVTAGLSAYFWLEGWGKLGARGWGLGAGDVAEHPFRVKGSEIGDRGSERNRQQSTFNSVDLQRFAQQSTNPQSTNLPISQSPNYLVFTLSALFAGLSLNIYLAARALPIFYGVWILYLAVTDWQTFRRKIWGVLWFTAVFALLTTPLFVFLQTNQGAEIRVEEVSEPLQQLQDGNWRPVVENGVKILGMFGLRGDPLWRQNVAFAPVFEPIVGILFYIGLIGVILSVRRPENAFVLLWTAVSITPSLVTINAPSSIRIIMILPILALFPAKVIHTFPKLSTVIPKLSTVLGKSRGILVLTIILIYAVRSAWFTFSAWPSGGDIPFVWQAAFSEIAETIKNRSEAASTITVAGWSPDTMDSQTMALLFDNEPPPLNFFNPQDGTLILAGDGGETAVYFPNILDFPPLQDHIEIVEREAFSQNTRYIIKTVNNQQLTINSQQSLVQFDDQIELMNIFVSAEGKIVSQWETLIPQHQPMRLFMQLLDENGDVIAEDYHWDNLDPQGLWFPHWQANVQILQAHTPTLADEVVSLRIGIFDPYTCELGPCQNLLTEANEPFILIPIEINAQR